MTLVQRITREPVLVIGLLTAAFGVATVFGVGLTADQTGAIVVLAGAIMTFLRFVTTPASEVVAQQTPGGTVTAGAAADLTTGTPVVARLRSLTPPPVVDEEP